MTAEAQLRHDQANRETVLIMAREILDDSTYPEDVRAEAYEILQRMGGDYKGAL